MPSSPVVLTTGNVNSINQLISRRHKNSSAEVLAAFQHFTAENQHFTTNNGIFCPEEEDVPEYSKDMKITLKVFLSDFNKCELIEAVNSFLATHHVDNISQLIAAFPVAASENLSDDDWIKKVLDIWETMEVMVDDNQVLTLGVADVDVERLKLLTEKAAKYPPTIDHYSIDGCCAVPPELVTFAKERDIQLLTHNDCREINLPQEIRKFAETLTEKSLDNYTEGWASRYTTWIRSRSILAEKGYFIQYSLKD